MTGELAGKRLVVVGASAGIGRAVAVRAARDGAELALVARRREPLDQLAQEIGGGTVITADLSVPEDCTRIGEEAARALGSVDVVLFTAAIARLRTLRQLTAEEWMQTLATNLVGTSLAISGLLPHLSDRGIVTVTSSESAGRPFYALASYADVVVGVFGALLPNRSVGMETLFLRSPAPPMGSTDTMTAAARATGHEPG